MITFRSVGNVFASVLSSIHTGLKAVEKILPSIQQDAQIVEGVTALIPGGGAQTALAIERVAFGVLGDVAAAVSAVDEATLAKGLSVTLDAEVAAAVKALVSDFKSELRLPVCSSRPLPRRPRESIATEIEGGATGRPLTTKGGKHGDKS